MDVRRSELGCNFPSLLQVVNNRRFRRRGRLAGLIDRHLKAISKEQGIQ
jgi:hypothetical protein